MADELERQERDAEMQKAIEDEVSSSVRDLEKNLDKKHTGHHEDT